jgi:hypothetical protein
MTEQPTTPAAALRLAAERLAEKGYVKRGALIFDMLCRWAGELDAAVPATYGLPPEPPPTVTGLWDRHGCFWRRAPKAGQWVLASDPHSYHPRPRVRQTLPLILTWQALLGHGRLSTVPPAQKESTE